MMGTGEHRFEVVSNEPVAQGVWRLRCVTPVAALLEPGQFVNISVPGDASHILRLPLSFARADASTSVLELVYAVVGEGTERLSRMVEGDVSTMVGPCGKGWRLPVREGRALLVAGGVGLPPVAACARMLAAAGVGFDVIAGSQTSARHVDYLLEELRCDIPSCNRDVPLCHPLVIVTTDDGTRGIHGFVTSAMENLLAEHAYAQVYTCGPQSMMAGVARLAATVGTPCQVSLERMMGCGFGACSCCNVRLVSGGYALCCTDGPVFDAQEVAW